MSMSLLKEVCKAQWDIGKAKGEVDRKKFRQWIKNIVFKITKRR